LSFQLPETDTASLDSTMEVYAEPDMDLATVSTRRGGTGYSENFENKENGERRGPAIDNLHCLIT
jgi:hypothetical protein